MIRFYFNTWFEQFFISIYFLLLIYYFNYLYKKKFKSSFSIKIKSNMNNEFFFII